MSSSPKVQWLVVGLLITDLFAFGMSFNPTASPRIFDTSPASDLQAQVGSRKATTRVLLPLESINRLWNEYYSYGGYGKRDEEFICTPLRYSLPNINMVQGIYNAEGYDAIRYLPYDRKLRQWEQELGDKGTLSPRPLDGREATHLIVKAPLEPTPDHPPLLIPNGSGEPRVVIEEPGKAGARRAVPMWSEEINRVPFGGTAVGLEANRVAMRDLRYPGWTASVNGKIAPVDSYESLFRQVQVPPGRFTGEFVYYPMSFKVGLFVTLCFIAGVTASLHRFGLRANRCC